MSWRLNPCNWSWKGLRISNIKSKLNGKEYVES